MTSQGFRQGAALALALAASACAQPQPPAPPPAAPATTGSCQVAPARFAIGHVLGEAIVDEMRRRSGANLVRVVRPGQVVTLEFSPDRLTVDVDAASRITAVRCG